MASSPINTTASSALAVLSSIPIQMSRALTQGIWRIKSQKSQPLWDMCNAWCSASDLQLRGPWTATLRKWPLLCMNLSSVTLTLSAPDTKPPEPNSSQRILTHGSRGNQCSVELLIYSPWKWSLLSICSREHSPKSPGNLPHWQPDPLQPDLKKCFRPSHLSGHLHLLSP